MSFNNLQSDSFNIQFNEAMSSNPEYLATIKTPQDLIPLGVLKDFKGPGPVDKLYTCLLYTSPSPRDKRQSRMPSSA